MAERLDTPLEGGRRRRRKPRFDLKSERTGRAAERIARFTGTPQFMIYLALFCISWLLWNTMAPTWLQFDKASLGFTALTLMLSLQASFAAPLILLAQNRQDDRDRVVVEQDRQRAEQNLADTDYLTREIAAMRLSLQDAATRDFIRSELRDLLVDISNEIRETGEEVLSQSAKPEDTPPDEQDPKQT